MIAKQKKSKTLNIHPVLYFVSEKRFDNDMFDRLLVTTASVSWVLSVPFTCCLLNEAFGNVVNIGDSR